VGHEPLSPLFGYPLSLLREEPELCVLALGLGLWRRTAGRRAGAAEAQRTSARWRVAGVMAFVVLALTLAALPGAAPTHHAGRALLMIWIVVAIYTGAWLHPLLRRPAAVALVIATLLLGAAMLRPWFARLDGFTARRDETAIGQAVQAAGAEPVLLEADNYAYYAVMAGSGRPRMFVLDRSLDPRGEIAASSFSSAERLRARIRDTGVAAVVGRSGPATRQLGEPRAVAGSWGLWDGAAVTGWSHLH
jgi:hypothetical protein